MPLVSNISFIPYGEEPRISLGPNTAFEFSKNVEPFGYYSSNAFIYSRIVKLTEILKIEVDSFTLSIDVNGKVFYYAPFANIFLSQSAEKILETVPDIINPGAIVIPEIANKSEIERLHFAHNDKELNEKNTSIPAGTDFFRIGFIGASLSKLFPYI